MSAGMGVHGDAQAEAPRTPSKWVQTRPASRHFFQKPTDAVQIVPPGVMVEHPYPSLTKNYHYEIELVAALERGGRDIPVDQALACVFGYTVRKTSARWSAAMS